ncbi:MAG: restriction endonuclease [Acidobacteriia bacterium]|nr:restriction endonuclease [Terriglobia bacterium]MYG04347.1 restriction endonuclease [Terriglobia bacterium]MYK09771.1 restriction endonuclease [Terriglobia bacterium]
MPIPNAQAIMLPLLDVARDQEDHRLIDAVDLLADRLRLTDDERRKRSSEGQQTRFYHSVFLARKHLTKSGLLEDPVRGQFRITELGRRVLESGPSQIDRAYLRQIEESGIATVREPTSLDPEPNTAITPEEALQDAYETLRNSLADELLGQVKQASPAFFELLVVDVLVRMGYGGSRKDAGEAIGQSGDEGIDGIIKEDRLGLDIIYIQAKRWSSTVGRPDVQRFAGALQGKRARKGVFITTSSFSREAVQFANSIETKVILVDGRQLAALMIDHGVGVRTDASYELKRIDSDYFPE